ncbi:hypothetical protein JTE90_000543 [Oedothorax gibbosus]|uniref:Uncharacterized protein n=1 Tax=Oedothorax gibbosus TaxID=931172 RepID=A0AAV6VXB7_9ARAC|nr:hypothetical protein JTE90_000543 [Oedothorax gibbosus]
MATLNEGTPPSFNKTIKLSSRHPLLLCGYFRDRVRQMRIRGIAQMNLETGNSWNNRKRRSRNEAVNGRGESNTEKIAYHFIFCSLRGAILEMSDGNVLVGCSILKQFVC